MEDKTQQEIKNCASECITVQEDVSDSNPAEDTVSNETIIVSRHLQVINEQLEKAKDPAAYDTYCFMESGTNKNTKLFTARKRGTKHVIEKIPCQDYCLATSVNGYTVLADADGVSSCVHSDVGSQFACEAVVRTVAIASKSCPNEEDLVSRLLSVSFREKLVSQWIKLVLEEVNKKEFQSTADQLKEFSEYGSTIMFAIITDNWIVAGNLGDGQILVFNDYYGLKLRVHAQKDSSRVRCLVNERCAREDFQIEKYPRNLFNGILLSTDGMYESLDKGTLFYDYAIQMKTRFLEQLSPEPYQAFCYKEEGEPYKDFSEMRTQDDCSVVLALGDRYLDTDYCKIEESILCHTQATFLRRQSLDCMSFYAKSNNDYTDVVVTPLNLGIEVPNLKTVELENPIETWNDGKYSYAMYKTTHVWTLEFMQCNGMLRVDKTRPYESAQMIMRLLIQLNELQNEVSNIGLVLNSSAYYNISYDGTKLFLKREALSMNSKQTEKDYKEIIDKCFSHVLGVLECSGNKQPLFDIGYIDRGPKYYMLGEYSNKELGQLVRYNRLIGIKNASMYTWQTNNGDLLHFGETVELTPCLSFRVLDDKGNNIQEYRYIAKENL